MLNKLLKIKVLIKVTLCMLNTTKNVLVDQNFLVVQLCCGYDEFIVEFRSLSTIRSCSKIYDLNMFGIQQYSSDTILVAADEEFHWWILWNKYWLRNSLRLSKEVRMT